MANYIGYLDVNAKTVTVPQIEKINATRLKLIRNDTTSRNLYRYSKDNEVNIIINKNVIDVSNVDISGMSDDDHIEVEYRDGIFNGRTISTVKTTADNEMLHSLRVNPVSQLIQSNIVTKQGDILLGPIDCSNWSSMTVHVTGTFTGQFICEWSNISSESTSWVAGELMVPAAHKFYPSPSFGGIFETNIHGLWCRIRMTSFTAGGTINADAFMSARPIENRVIAVAPETASWADPVDTAISSTSVSVLTAGSSAKELIMLNNGTNPIYLSFNNTAASPTTGFKLDVGSSKSFTTNIPSSGIKAVCASGLTSTLRVWSAS